MSPEEAWKLGRDDARRPLVDTRTVAEGIRDNLGRRLSEAYLQGVRNEALTK